MRSDGQRLRRGMQWSGCKCTDACPQDPADKRCQQRDYRRHARAALGWKGRHGTLRPGWDGSSRRQSRLPSV